MTSGGGFTQSSFFLPVFNSAIFDGPIRIYFSQPQEPLALNLHFEIQERNPDLLNRAKRIAQSSGAMVCIMIHPNQESFSVSFPSESSRGLSLATSHFGRDQVIGLSAESGQQTFVGVISLIEDIVETWENTSEAKSMALGVFQ